MFDMYYTDRWPIIDCCFAVWISFQRSTCVVRMMLIRVEWVSGGKGKNHNSRFKTEGWWVGDGGWSAGERTSLLHDCYYYCCRLYCVHVKSRTLYIILYVEETWRSRDILGIFVKTTKGINGKTSMSGSRNGDVLVRRGSARYVGGASSRGVEDGGYGKGVGKCILTASAHDHTLTHTNTLSLTFR